MTVDPMVLAGLLLLALELVVLAAVGYVVARLVLGQADHGMALAQGMAIGPALWGLLVNFGLYVVPGVAGTLVAWVITLTIATWLARHRLSTLRLPPRTVAGFAVVTLAIFWVALAGRQLLTIPDPEIHLELASAIRAGNWPPALPWNPWLPVSYHYGADLLIGLLAPPFGPDLGLVTEVVGAYAWTAFALVVATLLRRHGWLCVLLFSPLLLTAGAWTLIGYVPANVLQLPVPSSFPEAGLRASLVDTYWPAINEAELPFDDPLQISPPNIWKPPFVLAYALVVVVLTCAVNSCTRSWPAAIALAGLIGFVGLLEESVALVTLAVWALIEVWGCQKARRDQSFSRRMGTRSALGPVLATLLLVAGNGVITGLVVGSPGGAERLSFGWNTDLADRRPLGFFDVRPGGIALLGLGPLLIAGFAALLAWRERLVLALVAGTGAFLLAGLVLQYEPARDVTRLDGHARNFALLALLVALGIRLSARQPRSRYVIGACFAVLISWPTIAKPVHSIGLALSHGPRFEGAAPGQPYVSNLMRRYEVRSLKSARIAEHIQVNTDIAARILSPEPIGLTLSTGRPNAVGFPGHLHLHPTPGAEYMDAIRYLEPSAVRRLGYTYLHATEAWVARLPDRAKRWLTDPSLFEAQIHDGSDILYAIRPAFLDLEVEPAPLAFEALRRVVPASAKVYLSPGIHPLESVRAASVLSHAQVVGELHHADLYLLTAFQALPLGSTMPDYVVVSTRMTPSMLTSSARHPIWWNSELAVYALGDDAEPIAAPSGPFFGVNVTEFQAADGRISFTVVFSDYDPDQWRGQDWLVTATDSSDWAFPSELDADGQRHAGVQWYAGQIIPGRRSTVVAYEFDPRAAALAARVEGSDFTVTESSGHGLEPGVWTLAVRLRADWWEVALIPVMKIVVAEGGGVHYEVYEGELEARLLD